MTPSVCEISPSKPTIKSTTTDPNITRPSRYSSRFVILKIPYRLAIPSTNPICPIKLPIVSPTINPEVLRPSNFCSAPLIPTKSSGKSVPSARIVNPMNNWEILCRSAISIAPLMVSSDPSQRPAKPNIRSNSIS